MQKANHLRPFSFVLAVPDVERNTLYFRDALGFRADGPKEQGGSFFRAGTSAS